MCIAVSPDGGTKEFNNTSHIERERYNMLPSYFNELFFLYFFPIGPAQVYLGPLFVHGSF
jgi:hypothetical protein